MAVFTNAEKERYGYWIGAVVAALTVLCALVGGENKPLQVALCFLGGATGWTLGIAATPLDDTEKTHFSGLVKTVAAFVSGVLVAKLLPEIGDLVAAEFKRDGQLFSFRITLFSTLLVIGFLFTLIGRLYGEDPCVRCERKDKALLSKAQLALESIRGAKRET